MEGVEVRGDVLALGDDADDPCKAVLNVLQAGELVSWEVGV